MDRFDPFVKYADVYGDIINWEKDPMNKPQNQNKYFFSDGKTYYEQICKMLRLMSVFKEAFNQIYSNEDEISEAWENFVNNLSASVVEGSEPDVTLTWTDDSVNFEFTMVPGVPGEQGVGITSISFNSDYTMTITLSDGNTYTSMSLKGETGPQGPQGETGSGLQILDVYATLADLQSAHPTGQPGDAYQVGSAGNYTLYIWSSSQSAWVQAGTLGTVSPYTSAPLMDGTASAGSQNLYARGDHVHPSDTSRASKEELDALIKTSQALIDQSFTYRESPAIQDGLARIDKIKGNTLVWNQLMPTNYLSTSTSAGVTWTNNGDGSYNLNGTTTSASFPTRPNKLSLTLGHAYLFSTGLSSDTRVVITVNGASWNAPTKRIWKYESALSDPFVIIYIVSTGYTFNNLVIKPIVIDLTLMFGAGNEPTSIAEFTKLFSLPYYAYESGKLLNFNGTGIKVTGKNLLDPSLQKTSSTNAWYGAVRYSDAPDGSLFLHSGTYTFSFSDTATGLYVRDENNVQIAVRYNSSSITFTLDKPQAVKLDMYKTGVTEEIIKSYSYQLEFGSTATEYEAYTENTTNLPTETYFPTGMKSAGSVYDELTPTKAITRIGSVDLGTLNWSYAGGGTTNARFVGDVLSDISFPSSGSIVANAICSKYEIVTEGQVYNNQKVGLSITTTGRPMVYDPNFSDATAFKTAMSGVYLYYELATPTETAVDLDLDFMAYEDGTEQLLPVNGSVPSTSPIIADMTYLSIDDAMEYIIEKLANVPQNTQQILESLEDDVADLQTDVGTLQTNVSALQTSVGNINTNIGQLSSTVAGHTASISDMQSDITDLNTGLNDLEDTVTGNTSRIGTLETDLASTDGQVQSLGSSVSTLSSTVSNQGSELGEIDSIIQDISNNPVISALGSHELGFVAAYVDATLPANTGTRVTIPKPTIFPNNYTPMFIVGMSTGAYNVSICEIPPTFGNSDSVNCRVWNHGSQQTTQITVYILCMRQRQSQ